MTHGKSIRLFLVDGVPNGILTAEIVNWTGHLLSAPRGKLLDLIQRDECKKTGVYFLISENPEPPFYPYLYIGESDDVAKRLEQHNRDEAKGGKDFWERVCLITSKDQNLTKAHIRYLEKSLLEMAKTSSRSILKNNTEGTIAPILPEADIADMNYFLEQIRILMPVLGYDFLKSTHASRLGELKEGGKEKSAIAYFKIQARNGEINAIAEESEGEFTVLKGSKISKKIAKGSLGHGYIKTLRPYLIEQGIIDENAGIFNRDYTFKSPSAASAIIMGRSSNGRLEWKEKETGLSYGEYQEKMIKNVMGEKQLFKNT